jgi:hypothetical protein
MYAAMPQHIAVVLKDTSLVDDITTTRNTIQVSPP